MGRVGSGRHDPRLLPILAWAGYRHAPRVLVAWGLSLGVVWAASCLFVSDMVETRHFLAPIIFALVPAALIAVQATQPPGATAP